MAILGFNKSFVAFCLHICLLISASAAVEVIPHDKVIGFQQKVSSGVAGRLYLKYKPFLKVGDGCVPFPAVDVQGRVSGGLKPTGAINGKCEKNKGQVYTRAGSFNGYFGIMYSWYFPKDQIAAGPAGHKHDWESVVVWLSGEKDNARLLAICPSRHGKYYCKKSNLSDFLSGTHPKISYQPADDTHGLLFSSEKGGTQPLIGYPQLTEKARNALASHNWGSAVYPLKDRDGKFRSEMSKAKFW